MATRQIILYTDYKSPYAYLAKDPARELERAFDVAMAWRPYTLDIPSFLGSVEARTEAQWRKVRYAYMDARRFANLRGLTLRGPRKIYDSSIAAIGMLYAQRAGVFPAYNDLVFERFWRRELEIDQAEEIAGALAEAGADPGGFAAFLAGEGRAEHERVQRAAEAAGVFGVPTFVLDDELFWGHDRIDLLRRRLAGG